MNILRPLVALALLLATSLGLPACSSVSIDELKASDRKIVLLSHGLLGDKWAYENSMGIRTPLESCGLPVFGNCYKIPGQDWKLTYPPIGGSIEKDAKLSGLGFGEEFHCRKSNLFWDPEVICAIH